MPIISINGVDYASGGTSKIETILEADYQARKQAETLDPSIAYFRPEAPNIYPDIQDDGSATDLEDGMLATGRTIESYFSNKVKIYPNLSFVFSNSQNATINISDIDSNLVYTKGLVAFCTNAGTPLLAMINAAKTAVAVSYISGTHSGTLPVNLIAFY